MALYQYECSSCHRVTEELRPIPRRDRKGRCGSCGKGRLLRVISVPGMVGKQSGERGEASDGRTRVPMATFHGLKIDNCGTGIEMNGGHIAGENIEITNTPVGFRLRNGATVDLKKVRYQGPNAKGK